MGPWRVIAVPKIKLVTMQQIDLLKELQLELPKINVNPALACAKHLLRSQELREKNIRKKLQVPKKYPANTSVPENYSASGISDIQAIAVKYGLRFLAAHRFKNEIPRDAILALQKWEEATGHDKHNYYILAPKEMFTLKDCNQDPLLFAQCSNGNYVLIHKWGNDMNSLRKWTHFPIKSWKHYCAFITTICLFLTLVTPSSWLSSAEGGNIIGLSKMGYFAWLMLTAAAISVYYRFSFNKKFSSDAWNSSSFN